MSYPPGPGEFGPAEEHHHTDEQLAAFAMWSRSCKAVLHATIEFLYAEGCDTGCAAVREVLDDNDQLRRAAQAFIDAIDAGGCEVPAQQYLDLKSAVALVRR